MQPSVAYGHRQDGKCELPCVWIQEVMLSGCFFLVNREFASLGLSVRAGLRPSMLLHSQ